MAKVPLVRLADYDALKAQYAALLAQVARLPKGRVHRTPRTTLLSVAANASGGQDLFGSPTFVAETGRNYRVTVTLPQASALAPAPGATGPIDRLSVALNVGGTHLCWHYFAPSPGHGTALTLTQDFTVASAGSKVLLAQMWRDVGTGAWSAYMDAAAVGQITVDDLGAV